MTREELMIGDYVQVNGEVCKVISISYFDIGISDSKEDFYNEHIDNIKPIPLTSEILEKNGFENDFYHDESVADYHFVRLEGYSYREDFILVTWCNGELNVVNDLIGEVEIHCENVHELQHALRLCGINKEIEI